MVKELATTDYTDVSDTNNVKNRKKYDSKNTKTETKPNKPTLSERYERYKPVIFFFLGVSMTCIAVFAVYDSTNREVARLTDRNEEISGRMEYNNSVIRDKVAENQKINQEYFENLKKIETMLSEKFSKKKQKITNE